MVVLGIALGANAGLAPSLSGALAIGQPTLLLLTASVVPPSGSFERQLFVLQVPGRVALVPYEQCAFAAAGGTFALSTPFPATLVDP